MKKILTTLSFLILISLTNLQAQPGFDDDVEDTPIDGGIALLLFVGAGYGLKRIKENNNKPI